MIHNILIKLSPKTIRKINRGLFIARASKEYKNLNCKIDKEVSDKLEKFIEDTKMSKTATVERALTEFIEKYNKTGKI